MGAINGTPGNDVIHGTHGSDIIYAGAGNDTVYAYSGDDSLQGDAGNDYLWGGPGRDWMVGGSGNDILDGGLGYDTYIGGEGSDVFRFSHTGLDAYGLTDAIQNFQGGRDKIDLSAIDANTLLPGNQPFWFNDMGALQIPDEFKGKAGELIVQFKGEHLALICGDIDADRVAEFCVSCVSLTTKLLLKISDFIM